MTKEEFIKRVTEFAESLSMDLFPEVAPELFPEVKPKHKPYKTRVAFPRVSNIAQAYEQPKKVIDDIVISIGIPVIRDKKHGDIISREDCELLVKVITRKYNDFND
jgi:hypothetical protein